MTCHIKTNKKTHEKKLQLGSRWHRAISKDVLNPSCPPYLWSLDRKTVMSVSVWLRNAYELLVQVCSANIKKVQLLILV